MGSAAAPNTNAAGGASEYQTWPPDANDEGALRDPRAVVAVGGFAFLVGEDVRKRGLGRRMSNFWI
jgi:hypothetical protein